MDNFLNQNIKDVLDAHPEVQNILNRYQIGCVSCSLGTCQLKDIIEIHNLPAEDEETLLKGIAEIVYPGRDFDIPRVERKQQSAGRAKPLSPPVRKLVDEHCYIKKVIAFIPGILDRLTADPEKGAAAVKECVEFVQQYADRFHHAKEEDILFSYFDRNLDIVAAMLKEHEEGRAHVQAVIRALDEGAYDDAAGHFLAYGNLLTEHIRKEDEVLYPWMDRNLSDRQIGTMFSEFGRVDLEYGEVSRKWEKFADSLNA